MNTQSDRLLDTVYPSVTPYGREEEEERNSSQWPLIWPVSLNQTVNEIHVTNWWTIRKFLHIVIIVLQCLWEALKQLYWTSKARRCWPGIDFLKMSWYISIKIYVICHGLFKYYKLSKKNPLPDHMVQDTTMNIWYSTRLLG